MREARKYRARWRIIQVLKPYPGAGAAVPDVSEKPMVQTRIAYYLDGRLYEWVFSTSMVALGMTILVWPQVAHGSILTILTGAVGGTAAGLIFFVIGLLRIAALITNGNSMWIGPRIRSIGASVSSVLWSSVVISMAQVSVAQGFPSPMVIFFSAFTGAEVYISYRAVLDVRSR